MAWTFLAESADSLSLWRHGSDRSPTVKSTHTAEASFSAGCATDKSPLPPSGTISAPSILDDYPTLIFCTADSHARASVLQAMDEAWKTSEAAFIGNSIGSLASLSPDTSFWKTCLLSLDAAESQWCGRLPRWGMTVAGRFCQPPQLEPRSKANDGSCWEDSLFPRPLSADWKGGAWTRANGNHRGQFKHWFHGIFRKTTGRSRPCPLFVEWAMGYPMRWTDCAPWAIP